jgi:predicted TIM-barrel fold metal-dependent hydrolase
MTERLLVAVAHSEAAVPFLAVSPGSGPIADCGREDRRDWLAEFCRSDPARLNGIAMINLDDIPDAIRELERAARLGLAGTMITEYPFEHRRYDQSEYETFWAAAAALDLPLSLHTATRRQGKIRGVGDMTLRDASSRATKAFYPALSMCDLIFSGVFGPHPRLTVAIVEFELAWVPHVLSTMVPTQLDSFTCRMSARCGVQHFLWRTCVTSGYDRDPG